MNAPVWLPHKPWSYPRWDGRRGFYEVYFLKFNLPQSREAFWLRYTLLAPRSRAEQPCVEIWGFYFNPYAPERNWGAKEVVPLDSGRRCWQQGRFPLQLGSVGQQGGLCHLHLESATGQVGLEPSNLRWELHWQLPAQSLGLFPHAWLYRLPFPRTKYHSPGWEIRFEGTVELHGRRIEIQHAPGQLAHLWGTDYAHSWVWAHANQFDGESDAAFEALYATVHLGGRLRGMGIACLRWEDRYYALRGMRSCLSVKSEARLPHDATKFVWQWEAQERDFHLKIECEAEPRHFLGARYITPSGAPRYCHNTKVAAATLTLRTSGAVYRLTTRDSCALEWVLPEAHPAVKQWV
jgi:hypothetical protein